MKSKSTIEVNGKSYDAATGVVLGATSAPPLRTGGRSIDGFFRPRTAPSRAARVSPPVSDSIASLAAPVPSAPELTAPRQVRGRSVNHARPHAPQTAGTRTIRVSHAAAQTHTLPVRRGPANHVHHHAVQHSQILRRDAVPAPALSTHNLLRPKGVLQRTVPGLIAPKQSAAGIDPERLARAQSASKSPLVAHHAEAPHSVSPMFVPVAVQPAPALPPVGPTPPPGNGDAPTVPPPQQGNKPTDIFEHALANASNFVDMRGHKAHYHKQVRTHVASMALGSLALIIIAAFVAYQNNPGLQFKLASLKAGVSATMPNFSGTGFAYNGVRAGDGTLTLGLKGDSGTYQLTQANTNLSDADMIQVIRATDASGTPTYSVVTAGNVVVYRFSNTNATWVSGGKWYTVDGTGALTNGQVKDLVQHV